MKKQITTVAIIFFMMLQITLWAQWQNIGSGISSQKTIFSISAPNQNVIWAVAPEESFGACYDFTMTTDGGNSWHQGLLPDTIGDFFPGHIFAINDQTAWVIMINTPEQDRIRIFKTNNGGAAWQEQTGEYNTKGYAFATLHFFNPNEGIGFGSPGTGNALIDSMRIYHTIDGGSNWKRIPTASLPSPLAGEGVWVYGNNRYESKNDTLWFGTRASRVFRTTDRGLSWQAFNAGISGSSSYPGLASIAFQNSKQGIVTSYLPSQVAVTSDGGETWTKIPVPTTPRASDIEYIPGTTATYIINQAYLNTGNNSKYLISYDGGIKWKTVSYSPAIPVLKFLSPTVGFAGGQILSPTSGGIYKWTGNWLDSTITSTGNVLPKNPIIEVYPNPVKDKLTIELQDDISIENNLTLTLFNVFGQRVKQISINSKVSNIELGTLPAGIYFYRVHNRQTVFTAEKIVKE
ncbi:MAG TPA: T9SS type A sorting domain-containing protein [Saprospiraceae bacterium]|nr:T9SS type A sorting domain-containing protein [Saprospiraceae bacterium]